MKPVHIKEGYHFRVSGNEQQNARRPTAF